MGCSNGTITLNPTKQLRVHNDLAIFGIVCSDRVFALDCCIVTRVSLF
jgi:hypothetical protein